MKERLINRLSTNAVANLIVDHDTIPDSKIYVSGENVNRSITGNVQDTGLNFEERLCITTIRQPKLSMTACKAVIEGMYQNGKYRIRFPKPEIIEFETEDIITTGNNSTREWDETAIC